jgi:hypothetical protein
MHESNGDVGEAMKMYELATDALSLVRIACQDNNTDEAKRIIASATSDKAACQYYLGQVYESKQQVRAHFSVVCWLDI